jgi:hypothetical protein
MIEFDVNFNFTKDDYYLALIVMEIKKLPVFGSFFIAMDSRKMDLKRNQTILFQKNYQI